MKKPIAATRAYTLKLIGRTAPGAEPVGVGASEAVLDAPVPVPLLDLLADPESEELVE